MTEYLVFDTEEEAKTRSAEAWEQVLGRPKKPEDVTEFLWPVTVGLDGRAAVQVTDHADLLTLQESMQAVADLSQAGWQPPVYEEL